MSINYSIFHHTYKTYFISIVVLKLKFYRVRFGICCCFNKISYNVNFKKSSDYLLLRMYNININIDSSYDVMELLVMHI